MEDLHYQKFKKDLESFLDENFTVKLDTDSSETNLISAQVNTKEVLNERAIDGLFFLQTKHNFKNVTIGRSGAGLKIHYTL